MKKLLFFVVFIGFLAVLAVAASAFFWWTIPASGTIRSVDYEVKEGAGFSQVAQDLANLGVIRWTLAFKIYAEAMQSSGKIKAGPYVFPVGVLPKDVLDKLVKGEVAVTSFSIPEGWNIWQIAEKLSQVFPGTPKSAWILGAKESKLKSRLPTEALTLEGYLYPETYSVRQKAGVTEVFSAMVATFSRNFTPEIISKGKALGLTPHQIVTLASIVEKETGDASERPQISAVFHNRLKQGMRLQTDPTVIYGIIEKFDGNLRKRDLLTPSAYNTYLNAGLPPGPIANPGAASLKAAVMPADVPYIYFVGKGDGTHYFSSTLKEHNKAVQEYQVKPYRKSLEKKKGNSQP